ncbi:flippase [Petroclostridium sp. X23]|uniref:flippase n=1 Tax=Petroclostridium sp. X23 TaxID=3045146 RepID=UPI0024AE1A09|nr:flippase [Petroclostridium sp. X23]WHH57486.1 flippase [Petroclostridium sp. X23]
MGNEIRELGKKSTLVFTGSMIGQFISFISVIVIGRLLGAEIYGQFVYITSFLLFFTVIPKLGMENGIISFLSRNTFSLEEKKSILTYSLIIAGVLSIIIIVISYLNINFIYKKLLNGVEFRDLFLLLLPTVILDPVKAILRSSLRATRNIKEITFMDNLFNPISKAILVIGLVIVFNLKNYYSLVIPAYVSEFITITYYIVKLKNLGLLGKVIKDLDNSQIIKFSIPLLFTGIVSIMTQSTDRYMIGYLLGSKDVGIYKIAVQFGTISSIALVSVNTIFAPLISNLYHDNRLNDLEKMYRLTTKWITIINLMIFGMILVFSKDIMHVAGEEFIIGGAALIFISVGQVINSLVGSVGYINIMTGHPRFDLISGSTAMILNVILNLFLIIRYGINGAAIATAVALLIKNVMNFIFMYKNLRLQPYDLSYLKLVGVFVISVVSIFFISNIIHTNYFVRLIICCVIYSTIFLILVYRFVMSEKELIIFKSKINKKLKKL